jgi:hypothetical protein
LFVFGHGRWIGHGEYQRGGPRKMKKKNRTVPLIFLFLTLFSTITLTLTEAQKTESVKGAQVVQRKVAPEKTSVQKIRPGDVYPGDAAVAGYEEISSFSGTEVRSYRVKDKSGRTYIFSEVEGYLPGQTHGYFRALDYYGYGRGQENKREHLIFAARTPMPACKYPVKAECGNPLREAGGYIFLFFMGFGDFFAAYNPVSNYGSGELSYLQEYVPEQDIIDIDGDGNLEIKAFMTLRDIKRISVPITRVMAIYQYIEHDKNCGCSKFVKVKGRAYEKVYMEYANEMKLEKKMIAWLAAVECTENPDLIRTALDEFMNLPSPDQKEKQIILEMLINNGYGGLKIHKKNP